MARRRKKAEAEDAVRESVVEAMKAQSPSEREQRIVLLWTRWQEAQAYLTKVRSEHRTLLEAARATLKETMEQGVAAGDDEAAKRKLIAAESAWQDVEETKAQMRDAVGGAKDGVKGTFEQLAEAVAATQQIEMDFGGGTVEEHESDRRTVQ